jgi:hypothetical protein
MGLLRTLCSGDSMAIRRAHSATYHRPLMAARSGSPEQPVDWTLAGRSLVRSRTPEPPKDVVPPPGFEVVLHVDALARGSSRK